MTTITGKWLWIGATSFSEDYLPFDAICAEAATMGCTGIHPKIADGGNIWYDTAGLKTLLAIAEKYKLKCIPYHYVYGGSLIQQEAYITAIIGSVFGGVIPDMEDQYFGQDAGAALYGSLIRDKYHFTGLLLPTTYANIGQKNMPMAAISKWADGWMPQAYFSVWEWTPGVQFTAEQAIAFLGPQWSALDASLKEQGISPKPILPIISLGDTYPAANADGVQHWLAEMAGYGYCGFWHSGTIAPYKTLLTDAHIGTTPPPIRVSTPPLVVPQKKVVDMPPQHLSPEQLEAMWKALVPTIAWNPTFAIEKDWIDMVQNNMEIGHPKHGETRALIGGLLFNYVTFSSGWIIYYDLKTNTTFHMYFGVTK